MMNTSLNEGLSISICIPTYNRGNKVCELVKNILQYAGNDLEVVVVDNLSTDRTDILLSEIKDSRLKFFKNDENIGGPLNQLKALTLARAKFALFCLDKDKLDYKSIPELIRRITQGNDVAFGYCALNAIQQGNDIDYEKGFSSVLNMGYLSQHPTGIFYNTEIYKNLPLLQTIFKEKKSFPFYPDLVNAEMAIHGKSRIINYPAFYTETKDECRTTISFTYNEKNAFFSPGKRMVEFDTYINAAIKLGLTDNELTKLVTRLYNNTLIASTFAYRNIMVDYDLCAHHGMQTRKVGFSELWKLNLDFASHYLKKQLPISYFKKLYTVFTGHVKVLIKLILSK